MLCRIAELLVEVPEQDGLDLRCAPYLWSGPATPDITIHPHLYRRDRYAPRSSPQALAYMESAYQFYKALVDHHGFYLHASAVVLDGRAFLFSGPSRAGKSTHTRLWQQTFGPQAAVINDDKPAIRRIHGQWIAYGTPWCGKDGINRNENAPIAGVCFLKKAEQNNVRRLSQQEALTRILSQTIFRFQDASQLDRMLESLGQFLQDIPVYELENRPEPDAARMSRDAMLRGAPGDKL